MENNFRLKYIKYKNKYIELKKLEKSMSQQKSISMKGGSNIDVDENKTEIYLFKAEWCGHCKAFKSTWKDLSKNLKSKYNFKVYDADEHKKEIKQWGIGGFPTIIAKKGNTATEYVGPRVYESLEEFFSSI